MGFTYMPMFPEMGSFQVPGYDTLRTVLIVFTTGFGAFWLCLNMLFPRPLGRLGQRPGLALFVNLLPIIVLAIIEFATPGGLGTLLFILLLNIWGQQVGWGLYLLWYQRKHATSMLGSRQTTLVLWGSGLGLILLILHQVLNSGMVGNLLNLPLFGRMMFTNGVFIVLLLSPVTIAYAFGKYRLLEVEARLRRGTRDVLITLAMVGAYAGVTLLVWYFVLDALGIGGRTPSMIVALGLALGFAPLHVRVRRFVERYTFPERQRLSSMLESIPRWAGTLPDPSAMCDRLVSELRESLSVTTLECFLFEDEKRIQLAAASGNVDDGESPDMPGTELHITTGNHFIDQFCDCNHPVFVDEIRAMNSNSLDETDWKWIEDHGVVMFLPLHGFDRLLGFIASGRKESGDDFHPEEVRILRQLADRAGLSLENQRLLHENIEMQRMERELLFARDVQMRLLPLDLPATPGLEIAARVSFSTEVAGDYYDVLALPDGRTVFAVGDVAGKGVGAALLMSNLQASFRALSGTGLGLASLIGQINQMIHSNTSAEAYITFFVCIIDPQQKTLSYVNAGHNPPLLYRQGSPLRYLEKGGIVLGVLPEAVYEEAEIVLQPGDRLLIYTDGLSEATSDGGEEYGDQRVAEFFQSQYNDPPEVAIDTLLEDVYRHVGGETKDDDTTLLLIEVSGNGHTVG